MNRSIVHLDADAFFASVEQAADARLRGRPVAVGGESRGIIASASYEARRFGVYTPMPTVRARKLCPQLIVLPGDYDRYEEFSNWMFGYAYDFTPNVERTSIDEGYFDVTANHEKSPLEIADVIRRAIGRRLKISVSQGVGSSKLVSQIASKLDKPSAFRRVAPGGEAAFLSPLANHWLPGVGPVMSQRLCAAGLPLIGQIAAMPVDLLALILGGQAPLLHQFACGIDERPVIPAHEPQKTFSSQETFERDVTDEGYVHAILGRMADQLFARVRQEGRAVRVLTVKVRYNDRDEGSGTRSLQEPTDMETEVYGLLGGLLRQAWSRRVSLRMVALKLSRVYDGIFAGELPLTGGVGRRDACVRLTAAVDDLRRKHGWSVLLRGHDLRLREPPCEDARVKPGPRLRFIGRAAKPTRVATRVAAREYVPLRVRSYYSFMDSTLSPRQMVEWARAQGMKAVGMVDTGNLHGAAELAEAAADAGIQPIFGAELNVAGHPLLLYVQSSTGYVNLNRILSHLSEAERDGAGGVCREGGMLPFTNWLGAHGEGLIAVSSQVGLAEYFPGRFYFPAGGTDGSNGHPVVAVPVVHYAGPGDRIKYDILQSMRTLTLLRQPHALKKEGGAWHFRSLAEMQKACAEHPEWLEHTVELAGRCAFQFPFGKPILPAFHPPDGSTPGDFLHRLALDGLHRRYGVRAAHHRAQVEQELAIIQAVGYEEYFLVVWNILQACRRRGIDWITRGSAADSLVCYCLGISDVCPVRFGLYFRRFLNLERMSLNKLPDIDVDFPHDRKDDVVDLVFQMHGRENCAVVGGFSTFQSRSAFADVAKVLGLAEREARAFTRHFPWTFGGGTALEATRPGGESGLRERLAASPETRDLPLDEEPYKTAMEMAAFLDGFPRNPKMHPCGIVISSQPICHASATFISSKGYPTTHLDMDALEAMGLIKMDFLAQGGLAVIRDVLAQLALNRVQVDLDALAPWEDSAVWEMIRSGGARAVHHIESPAMTGLCRRCGVRDMDTLVAMVSVIRPGAANEGKKNAFIRRCLGLEQPDCPDPLLVPILRDTFGLVVYEEHVLQICEVFAGLGTGRADMLRRALGKNNSVLIEKLRGEFYASAAARGHAQETIGEVWKLVSGFAGYAFCKAHSAAYGVEAYQSAWLKRYHPAEFMAAVLTHGKGFYDPLVYVLEARRLGLSFLLPSVNEPGRAFAVHGSCLRVPLTHAKGLSERVSARILAARAEGAFTSLADFFRRVQPLPEEVEIIIRSGAFDEFGQTRTSQFWEAQRLRHTLGSACAAGQGWLLPPSDPGRQGPVGLSEGTRHERLMAEAALFGYPISGHPLEVYADIAWETYCPIRDLCLHQGRTIVMCGLVVEQRVHHQVNGEYMKFLTLADWTGMVEAELFAASYKSHGLSTVRHPVLEITALVEPDGQGRWFSLRVMHAGKPRNRPPGASRLPAPVAWQGDAA